MSAIAEPIPAVQQEAAASENANRAPITSQNPLKLELGNIVGALKHKAPKPLESAIKPADEKKEEKPVEVKETLKETAKEPEKPAEPVKPAPEIKHNREHFKVLEEARDKAAAEAAEWKKKFEEFQKAPQGDWATKLTDYEKRLAEADKEREELRGKVRQVDITLDPQFEKEFTQPVVQSQNETLNMLLRAGVAKDDAIVAVQMWDYARFEELTADMPGIQKRLFDARILETERLAQLRNSQITKPEDYQARQRQQMEAAQKQAVEERLRFVNEIEQGAVQATPELADEANLTLMQEMRNGMVRAAKAEMQPKEMIAMVGQAIALQHAIKGQHAALQDMAKQIEERDAKIADLEKFVKANGSGTLKGEAGGGQNGETYVPLSQRIAVRA